MDKEKNYGEYIFNFISEFRFFIVQNKKKGFYFWVKVNFSIFCLSTNLLCFWVNASLVSVENEKKCDSAYFNEFTVHSKEVEMHWGKCQLNGDKFKNQSYVRAKILLSITLCDIAF